MSVDEVKRLSKAEDRHKTDDHKNALEARDYLKKHRHEHKQSKHKQRYKYADGEALSPLSKTEAHSHSSDRADSHTKHRKDKTNHNNEGTDLREHESKDHISSSLRKEKKYDDFRKDRDCLRRTHHLEDSEHSDDHEISDSAFDFKKYTASLNKIFFRDQDLIQRYGGINVKLPT